MSSPSSSARLPRILSIHQPWAWLIVNGYKDIENRSWNTSYRGSLLIHAGKAIDRAALASVRLRFPQIVLPLFFETGGIVGSVTLADVVTHSASPWFVGPYGFVLEDARVQPFVRLRGQLGLFPAPQYVLDWLAQARSHPNTPGPVVPEI